MDGKNHAEKLAEERDELIRRHAEESETLDSELTVAEERNKELAKRITEECSKQATELRKLAENADRGGNLDSKS